MRSSPLAIAALAAFVLATPATAQFGALKKKIKNTAAPAQGGTIVLTSDVVSQLVTGLKAGQAERDAAAKDDSPYSRYVREKKAYAEAKPKCEAAQASWPQRAAANQKLNDKYSRLTQKMVDAMQKQDQKTAAIYQDSAMAMMDPSCAVKEPEQPKDYYETERAIEVRAENAEVKASGWTAAELAMVKERTDPILRGTPAADISASEKAAVSAKAAELKPLMGIEEQPVARAHKPAPAPTPAAATPTPQVDAQTSAGSSDMSNCMMKNMQTHQPQLEALGQSAQAAQKAGDQAAMLAIADTVQQIQMAGCMKR
jgi:hypothetical protein